MLCHLTPLRSYPDNDYGTTNLHAALARFIALKQYPGIRNTTELERKASRVFLHFRTFPVWHYIKFTLCDIHGLGVGEDSTDAIHTQPRRVDKRNRTVPARFDTGLISDRDVSGENKMQGAHQTSWASIAMFLTIWLYDIRILCWSDTTRVQITSRTTPRAPTRYQPSPIPSRVY